MGFECLGIHLGRLYTTSIYLSTGKCLLSLSASIVFGVAANGKFDVVWREASKVEQLCRLISKYCISSKYTEVDLEGIVRRLN